MHVAPGREGIQARQRANRDANWLALRSFTFDQEVHVVAVTVYVPEVNVSPHRPELTRMGEF